MKAIKAVSRRVAGIADKFEIFMRFNPSFFGFYRVLCVSSESRYRRDERARGCLCMFCIGGFLKFET